MYANIGMLKEGCVRNVGEEDFARQGYGPRSLVVLLQVACIDMLCQLILIHILHDSRTSREDSFDNERAVPVGSEFTSNIREVDGSQN